VKEFSVIIPTYNFVDVAKEVIVGVLNQTLLPKEIIIIDSSEGNLIQELTNSLTADIPIIYHKVSRLFPGEARNKGATLANYEWLAFLDSKTVPTNSWLKDSNDFLIQNKLDVVFGSTKYLAKSDFQKSLQACTFGKKRIETTPGSIISSINFTRSEGFQEGVRTGDDLAWRQKILYLGFSGSQPDKFTLTYDQLPTKTLDTLKRFFIYQLHGSRVNIQNTSKNIMLSVFMVFLTILIPKWNALVGWEASPFYAPNITKFYVSFLILLSLVIIIFRRDLLEKYAGSILYFAFLGVGFCLMLYGAFNWNGAIAGWVEDSVWYVPNITKIYVIFILTCSLLYRGIYFPLTHGIKKTDLFPFWWLKVALLGLLLDIAKAPGYILGALMQLLNRKIY
jgi:glycosyltransferase involved in cell wall biosynthesis